MGACVTVTRGISGSPFCESDMTVVFQDREDVESEPDPSAAEQTIEVLEIFSIDEGSNGKQATMIPKSGMTHEISDFRAEP